MLSYSYELQWSEYNDKLQNTSFVFCGHRRRNLQAFVFVLGTLYKLGETTIKVLNRAKDYGAKNLTSNDVGADMVCGRPSSYHSNVHFCQRALIYQEPSCI